MKAWRKILEQHLAAFSSIIALIIIAASPVNAGRNFVHPRLIVVDSEKAAGEILAEINSGRSFALLAKERSTDESSRDRYGDLGPVEIVSLAAPLRKSAAVLKDGEVSNIIKLDESHYALLQLVDLSYYRIGARAFKAGQYATAVPNLLKHIEINPDAVKARVMLGRIYESRKDAAKAETAYRGALFYDNSNEEAYSRLGALYMGTEQYEKANTLYEEATKHHPDTEIFKLGIKAAAAHLRPAVQATARPIVQPAVQPAVIPTVKPTVRPTVPAAIQPVAGKVFLRIIVAANEQEARDILSELQHGKAFPYLAKTRSVDEKSRASLGYLGEVEVSTLDKAVGEALSGLKPGTTSDVIRLADNRYVIVQKTDIHYLAEAEKAFAAGDQAAAEEDLLRHVELNPDSVKALAMLGKICEGKKDFAKAEKLYRQAIFYDPSAVLIYERLGRVLLLLGQYAKAKELYEEGLSHVPSSEALADGLETTDILLIGRGNRVP